MKNPLRQKPDTSPAATAPGELPKTSAELDARVAALRERHKVVTQEILHLEKAGVRTPETQPEPKEAALDLLMGAPVWSPPIWSEPQTKLATLHTERTVLNKALAMAENRSRMIAADEAARRIEAHRPEWNAAVRAVTMTLFQLERDLQELDRMRRVIRPLSPLQFQGWPLCGRLVDRATQLYRWTQIAANEGIVTQKEFDTELDRADAAR